MNIVKGLGWIDVTWNVVRGCTHCSTGCAHCHAERLARRFGNRAWNSLEFHPERLDEPAKIKKPKRILVCLMSDYFHPRFKASWRRRIESAMQRAPQHTYYILTKRPENMRRWKGPSGVIFWLGVSAENQAYFNRRWAEMILRGHKTRATGQFLCAEPLLGPIDISVYGQVNAPDWVIVGAERGSGARPCQPEWIRKVIRTAGNNTPIWDRRVGNRFRHECHV